MGDSSVKDVDGVRQWWNEREKSKERKWRGKRESMKEWKRESEI